MIKPQQPNTGMQLEPGYDRKLWTWINSLELKLTDLQNSIMAQATLELGLPLGGGDNYTGYFKVIKDGETYSVVDGANEDATNCGYVVIGNDRVAVPKVTGLEASGTGAFFIETTYDSEYVIDIDFAETLPEADNGDDIKLIADLDSDTIIQRLYCEHVITRWV